MLTGNKTTFKVRQMVPDVQERMLSQSGTNSRSRDVLGLCCLPGEVVLQRVLMVRKKLSSRGRRGWLSGTLLCTPFRVAFVPQDSRPPDDNADPVLLGDHDVSLASIEKVVVVGPSRTKLLTPSSSLRFPPEELLLYCRDMKVVCFLFDRLTPDQQVIEMTFTIAKTYQPPRPGAVLSLQNAALGSVEMKQFLSNRRRDNQMLWFESSSDWQQELERCGAIGWRVSSVNDRFEMSTSLSRFIVVPQKVFDTELKKSFAHFNEGRIPRWCWRHPRGSDLLRMSSFQNNIYYEKDDIRNLEMVLFGCQSSLCVVVELSEELPSAADIQSAHSRLRSLCLGDVSTSVSVPDDKWLSTLESSHWLEYSRACLRKAAEVACLLCGGHLTVALQEPEDRDLSCLVSCLVQVMCDPHCRGPKGFQSLVQKEWVTAGHRFYSRFNYHRDNDKDEAPVFLLFLDCVWQLWAQFPSRFQLTDDFLLALHDSAHLPLFSTFMANCQRERCRRPQNSGQSYTPVIGWRDMVLPDPSDPSDPPLPPVWDWTLQFSQETVERFSQPTPPTPPTPPLQPMLNGNLNTNLETQRLPDSAPGSIFLFSRGTFSCPPNLPPWRSGTSGVSRKSHRRAPSSEGVPGLERLLKTWNPAGFPRGPGEAPDPSRPLLPLLMGPCLGLWRQCYLRGALHAQAFSHPVSSTHLHPVERLAREVQHLQEKLAQVDLRVDPAPPGTTGTTGTIGNTGSWSTQSNLNQNSNTGTFLFPAARPSGGGGPGPAVAARAPPVVPAHPHPRQPCKASAPPGSGPRDAGTGNKHTFLFGPNQRSDPPAATVPTSNGPSPGS